MHEIYFYKDRRGKRPVYDYIQELNSRYDKDSRIKAEKIIDYIQALSEGGTPIGYPRVRHLDGDIWELRPLSDRILFAAWVNGGFLLLHCFTKKTQKTPPNEIKQAKRKLVDWLERSAKNE